MLEGTAPMVELTECCVEAAGHCWPLHWCLSCLLPSINCQSEREKPVITLEMIAAASIYIYTGAALAMYWQRVSISRCIMISAMMKVWTGAC